MSQTNLFTNSLLSLPLPFTRVPSYVIVENQTIMKNRSYQYQQGKVNLTKIVENMAKNTYLTGGDHLEDYLKEYDKMQAIHEYETDYYFYLEDCLTVAQYIKEKYSEEVAVLNLAQRNINEVTGSWWNPYAGTQEEYIERHSAVYRLALDPSLNPYLQNQLTDKDHHIPKFGTIYTQNVPLIRDANYKLIEPYFIDIIAASAIDLRQERWYTSFTDRKFYLGLDDEIDWNLYEQHTQIKIETILLTALKYNQKHLILGAFGCGVFANPVSRVAKLFFSILHHPSYRSRFKSISFAITDPLIYQQFLDAFNESARPEMGPLCGC